MTDLAKLIVKLEAQTAQYQAELKKATGQLTAYQRQTNARLSAMQKGWSAFGLGIKRVLGAAAVIGAVRGIAKATADAEFSLAQLTAAVKSTGGAAGFTVPQLVQMSEAFQRNSVFADEAVQSMQAVLLGFRRIKGPEFEAAQQAILDLSSRLGTDLQSSAILVGKALNDPIKGMTALAKKGVQFTDVQKGVIEGLVRTGQTAKAQGIILEELATLFGGAASAKLNTFGGAIEGLKNAFNDLMEAKGGLPEATSALRNLTEILQDPGVKDAADTLLSGLIKSMAWIIDNGSKIFGGIAVIFGVAGDRIERINAEIEDLQNFRSGGGGVVFGDAFGEKGLASVLSRSEIDARVKALIEEQNAILGLGQAGADAAKKLRELEAANAGAAGAGFVGDPEALETLEGMIEAVELQIATYDKGAAAVLAYRFAHGDLADVLARGGPAAEALRDRLLALTSQYERMGSASKEAAQAQTQILDMVAALEEEIATLGLGEVAVLSYRLEHGKLAATFAEAGVSMEEYKARLLELTAELERRRAVVEAAEKKEAEAQATVAEGAAIFEATRTAAERYAAELARLDELLVARAISQDTYNRAALEAGERFKEAGREVNKFAEEATRNVQDLLAGFLEDLALSGKFSFESLLSDFKDMLIRMGAQALAANIAGKLFGGAGVGGGGGLLGAFAGAAGSFFGGFGGGGVAAAAGGGSIGSRYGGPRAFGGDVRGGDRVRVGERGRAEWFFPGMDGKIVPESEMGRGAMVVNNNFVISAPTGSVSRQTQLQIAAAAARGAAEADRRNN